MELEKRIEDLGMTGPEYEAHLATAPVLSRDIQVRTYYEVRPLYEFMIGLLGEFSLVSAPINFDLTIMIRYERYLTILCASNDPTSELMWAAVKITQCLRIIKRMIAYEIPYHNGMEACLKLLDFGKEGYPNTKTINAEDGYKGEDFEELVDKYCEELAGHKAAAQKIAAENLAKQLAKQGGDTE